MICLNILEGKGKNGKSAVALLAKVQTWKKC
jgi:hypothetical protein